MTNQSRIPISFIESRLKLNWPEIAFGVRQGWVDPKSTVDLAIQRISNTDNHLEAEIELAGVVATQQDRIAPLLEKLVASSPTVDDRETKLKWLRILLAWIFQIRDELEDPFDIVEALYADFDYPDEIRELIRYNDPSDGYRPQDHTEDENRERLLDIWRNYLSTNVPVLDSTEEETIKRSTE